MPKDKAYWKAYNQKRQAYLKQKKQESRQRLKSLSTTALFNHNAFLSTTDQTSKVVDHQVVDIPKVVDSKAELVVDLNPIVDILVVDKPVVDQRAVVDNSSSQVVDITQKKVVDQLTQLIYQYQSGTNYNCALGCSQNKYCSNCWYFANNQLIDYKGGNYAYTN